MSARELDADAAAGFHRLDAERQAEMGLAGAGRTDQVDGLGATDELQSGERHDAGSCRARVGRRSRSR